MTPDLKGTDTSALLFLTAAALLVVEAIGGKLVYEHDAIRSVAIAKLLLDESIRVGSPPPHAA